MARPKKPIAETGATETVDTAVATPVPTATQAPETTDAEGGVAAPSDASVDPVPETVQPETNDLAEPQPTRGPAGWVVKVTGPAMGRWRAGRKFGPEPVMIPAPELTEADMSELVSDPELICELTEVVA